MTVKLIIMDVDGTIYDQPQLRWKMLFEMLRYFSIRPWKWNDAACLMHFRREREANYQSPVASLEEAQYEWAANKTGRPPSEIKSLVQEWMFQRPLKYLLRCKRRGLDEFVASLKSQGVRLVFLSDHPAEAKLKAMNLGEFASYSATCAAINAQKPAPTGLLYIASTLGVAPESCLVIGDRDDRDGEAARRARMNYAILSKTSDGNTKVRDFSEIRLSSA